jgi:hypothetical protein
LCTVWVETAGALFTNGPSGYEAESAEMQDESPRITSIERGQSM